MTDIDKQELEERRQAQRSLDIFVLIICPVFGAISIFCLPLIAGIITLAAITLGYILYSVAHARTCDVDIPVESRISYIVLRIASVFCIGILCTAYIVAFSDEYDAITKATTPVEATVISVQNPDTRPQLILEYLDSQGTTQQASLRVRGYDMDYASGDIVQIKYSKTNPELVCSGNITLDSTLSTLHTSKDNPDIVNRS